MTPVPEEIVLTVYRLRQRQLPLAELEQWVYTELRLETLLPADDYIALLAIDYRSSKALHSAEVLLQQLIDELAYYEWQLRGLLGCIAGRQDAARALAEMYACYCDGFYFLEILGLNYGLQLDIPYEAHRAELWLDGRQCREQLDCLYPEAGQEAQRVLDWLDSGTIRLTGFDADGRVRYDDRRTDEQRQALATTRKQPRKWWKFW